LNPAVTLGLFFSNKITLLKLVCYIPMQMLGAITGAGLVKAVNTTAYLAAGGGANQMGSGMSSAGGWGLETISTFALVFTVLCATDGVRYPSVAHLPVCSHLVLD
jgi:aquaporin PIP